MRLTSLVGAVVVGWVLTPVVWAQGEGFTPRKDADQIPSYELVSIHKTAEAKVGQTINNESDGFIARDSTLRMLIAEAYGFSLGELGDQQLVGTPDWGKTQLFEVHGKVDAEDVEKLKAIDKADTMMTAVRELVSRTPSARSLMLQRLLEDRFKVKVHYEQRVMATYEMTVAKGGVKMKTAHPKNPENGNMQMNAGKLTGDNVPVPFIGAILALEVQRPVEDKTGVEGNYDFELHWTRMGDAPADNGTEDSAPSFYTALQEQMGLKLKSSKGPVWVIVVDHAEMPDEN